MSSTIYPEKCPNCGNPRGHMNWQNQTSEYSFNCFLCGYRNTKNLIPEYWERKKNVILGEKAKDEKLEDDEQDVPIGCRDIGNDVKLEDFFIINSQDQIEDCIDEKWFENEQDISIGCTNIRNDEELKEYIPDNSEDQIEDCIDEKWYEHEEYIPVGAAEIWHDNGLGSYHILNSEDDLEAFKSSFILRFNDPNGGIKFGDKNTLKEFRDNKFYVTNLETMTTKEYLPEVYFEEIEKEGKEEMEKMLSVSR